MIEVLAADHGGATFFDMELATDIASVPEPSILLLLGSGLTGIVAWRRRQG